MNGGSPPRALSSALFFRSAITGLAAAVLVGGVSFLIPKTYRAEVRILPSANATSALQNLAGGGGLSGMLEIATQRQENPVQTFPEILLGRVVLDRTLHRGVPANGGRSMDVMGALRIPGSSPRERQYRGIRRLRELMTVSANPRTGIISVAVETRDSTLSAHIANSLIEELDHFNVETRRSQGKAVREFLANRLTDAQRELGQSEAALASFRQSNMRIGNSPQLMLEEERLKRSVLMHVDTYQLLARQFEMARIEEYRDTPTFTIVEPAIAPYRKYKPQIALNAVVAFLITGLISVAWKAAPRMLGVGPLPQEP